MTISGIGQTRFLCSPSLFLYAYLAGALIGIDTMLRTQKVFNASSILKVQNLFFKNLNVKLAEIEHGSSC